MFLIDWMPQSAMTLYIYRVGWTYPAKIPFTNLNLWKSLVVLGLCLDQSDRSDPPVGSYQTSYSAKTGQTAWSDWLD